MESLSLSKGSKGFTCSVSGKESTAGRSKGDIVLGHSREAVGESQGTACTVRPMEQIGLATFDDLIQADGATLPTGTELGQSREKRPIHGWRFGDGPSRISLLGGCHADEPTGPRLLRALVALLGQAAPDSPMLTRYSWWILPHINPDGEARNRDWHTGTEDVYDLHAYTHRVIRELPGDDLEFGFPRDANDHEARPEARAAYDWWQGTDPFHLHASLHGMGFAAGPWFLIEAAWQDRSTGLQEQCRAKVAEMGYVVHDIDRGGEKGFYRISKGFSTRPDSRAMAAHFTQLGDHRMASKFRPSSMETIRAKGGDPLTIVSEMPLFIMPSTAPGDWRKAVRGRNEDAIEELCDSGIRPMPVRDQMRLQWEFICAAVETVIGDRCSRGAKQDRQSP